MDNDERTPPRRLSQAHDRPVRAPTGPRIRTRTRDVASPGPASPDEPPDDTPQPKPILTPPPLTPPPHVTFDPAPIPWKGLPLEVAQWTFSSAELQEIVSKAIRLSARDSFVRLLSLQALEVDVVHETERLDSERARAQAKWRFEVGRRTMLIQALNAASSVPNPPLADAADSPVPAFIAQLASSIASCDALLASILQFQDQQSQIALIQHQHWSSALGIALRKLNRAYERQGQELKRAQARVQTLEDELEEAWREAERVAIEFDDFEQEIAVSESDDLLGDVGEELAIIGPSMGPDDVIPDQPLDFKLDPDETGTFADATTLSTDVAIVLGVTATAVASKATLVSSPASPKQDRSDTKSIRSVKSTRSRRSTRDGTNHASRVSAARTRSRAASNSSLRLPKSLRSQSSTHTSPVDPPPMPALPLASVPGQSFLDMDSLTNEHARKAPPPQEPTLSNSVPSPPHAAQLPPTRVPSIWLETDGGTSTRLNGLDRTHSLQIFSSLTARTPTKARRSNLVMSLTGSDRGPDSPVEAGAGLANPSATNASPTSNTSPVSLPSHPLAHFRGTSDASSGSSGVCRPGSADARLTTTGDMRLPMQTPRRSLVSRASSVILRRLSQATNGGGNRLAGGGSKASLPLSPVKARLSASGRTLERWREGDAEEGEVILIGSPHTELIDNL